MLKVPRVMGVSEARKEISHIMEATEGGETFLIKGPRHREALIVNPEALRRLQAAYMDLVGELETQKILWDEEAMRALAAVAADEARERFTLNEVAGMVGEDEK